MNKEISEDYAAYITRMLRPLDKEALKSLEVVARYLDVIMSVGDRHLIETAHHWFVKPLRAAVDHLCVDAGVPLGSSAVLGPVADKMVENIVKRG